MMCTLILTHCFLFQSYIKNQIATVQSTDPATGIITLTSPLPRKVTAVDDGYGEMYAVEVALLDRYITFEPYDQEGMIGG